MLAWLAANFVNFVLILAVAALLGLIVRGMVRDRKAGKTSCGSCSSCGGACAGCPMAGACHGGKPAGKTVKAR